MDVRTFAEAMRAVSAAASQELPAVLETVASQAESLLDCRGVAIDLTEGFGDGLVFRRARIPSFAASLGAGMLPTWRPRPERRRRLEAGDVIWVGDFQADLDPIVLAERPWLREIGSRLLAPLLADDELIGVLSAVWSEPGRASPEQLQVAEALGRAAAVAVRTARLLQSQRALVEAARVISSTANRDLDATLDVLIEQASALLRTDDVTLHLIDPLSLEFVRRRVSALARLGERTRPGTRFAPDRLVQEVIATGRPVFTPDFQGDPRITPEAKADLPSVVASLAMPLVVDGEPVGGLFAHWTGPHRMNSHELETADAFARQAALAIRGARLLEERERARRELEAVLDAASDSVVVYRADGRLVRANRIARQRFVDRIGEVPRSLDEYLDRARPTQAAEPMRTPAQRALDGETADGVLTYADTKGRERRFHVHAAPILGSDGSVQAAVVVSRDITDLEDAIAERARLDGAVKTARLVAHQLNTKLAIVLGNAEMLRADLDGADAELADDVLQGADDAARIVARLQRLIRFEETEMAGIAMLDLDAATSRS
ncbi:MAG TPA: GAF domain-containing protein [Chloroflexota bacterium]